MSIVDAINDFAEALAVENGGVMEIRLDARTYERFTMEVQQKVPVDLHEVCGDYDRPSSPWYGSRPMKGSMAYAVYTSMGQVYVKGPRQP
jgi:hypothetical protein